MAGGGKGGGGAGAGAWMEAGAGAGARSPRPMGAGVVEGPACGTGGMFSCARAACFLCFLRLGYFTMPCASLLCRANESFRVVPLNLRVEVSQRPSAARRKSTHDCSQPGASHHSFEPRVERSMLSVFATAVRCLSVSLWRDALRGSRSFPSLSQKHSQEIPRSARWESIVNVKHQLRRRV